MTRSRIFVPATEKTLFNIDILRWVKTSMLIIQRSYRLVIFHTQDTSLDHINEHVHKDIRSNINKNVDLRSSSLRR